MKVVKISNNNSNDSLKFVSSITVKCRKEHVSGLERYILPTSERVMIDNDK
jgi:hypothetical protein